MALSRNNVERGKEEGHGPGPSAMHLARDLTPLVCFLISSICTVPSIKNTN